MNFDKSRVIIGSICLALLGLIIIIFLDWFSYNIIYKPLYLVFGSFLYLSYFFNIFKWILFLLVLIASIYIFTLDFKKNKLIRIKLTVGFQIVFLIVFFSIILRFVGEPYFLDLEYVKKGNYLIAETDLSKYKKRKRKSSKYYYLSIPKLDAPNRGEVNLDMNVYQYKDIERLYLENGSKKIKVYYLPNTKTILRYELLN